MFISFGAAKQMQSGVVVMFFYWDLSSSSSRIRDLLLVRSMCVADEKGRVSIFLLPSSSGSTYWFIVALEIVDLSAWDI